MFRNCRQRWICGLRRSSAANRVLGSRVQIPQRAWIFFSCVSFVGSCPDGPTMCVCVMQTCEQRCGLGQIWFAVHSQNNCTSHLLVISTVATFFITNPWRLWSVISLFFKANIMLIRSECCHLIFLCYVMFSVLNCFFSLCPYCTVNKLHLKYKTIPQLRRLTSQRTSTAL